MSGQDQREAGQAIEVFELPLVSLNNVSGTPWESGEGLLPLGKNRPSVAPTDSSVIDSDRYYR